MTEQRRKAIWAIYGARWRGAARLPRTPDPAACTRLAAVWCRRTDELVDGPNSPYITPAALDRWTVRAAAGRGRR